jgi:hypothetical protein
MTDRPLILFPSPEDADRVRPPGGPQKFSKPTITRQFERLEPKFTQLQKVFETRNIAVQQSAVGIEPEFALVFETIGSVDSFYTAVKHIPDLEWMFDLPVEQIIPDEDFFLLDKKGQPKEGELSGKIYCVMTNKRAIDELISLWTHYKDNPEMEFARGFAGVRDVFLQLGDIRYWSAKDRVEETGVLEYWAESVEIQGDNEVNFEVELFYRKKPEQRQTASQNIRDAISSLSGHVISECTIENISYHCILASLPRSQIQSLVDNYADVELVRVEDIMFFRPVGQIMFQPPEETSEFDAPISEVQAFDGPVIAAILDGYPMQNHALLSDRILLDDPDDWGNGYLVRDRIHGTAMASLVIYGDYSSNQIPTKRKVYIRPIFKPVETANGKCEIVPSDIILVDLIHRAVRRLFEGEGQNPPVAPTVKLINLSLGDPARCFVNMMSPLARLLDWLSYKYKVLFVISAGNHNTYGIDCGIDFSSFKQLSDEDKEKIIIQYMDQNSRNFRLLSPAESINSLTIGALFADGSVAEENDNLTLPYHNPLPSPISAMGLGYNHSIKPDIFFNGGRKFLTESIIDQKMKWAGSGNPVSRAPGSLVAVPGAYQDRSYKAYTFGTSDAAAQISHEGIRCFDILEDIFLAQTGTSLPDDYGALLIKAMLVHGASWGENANQIAHALNLTGKNAHRLHRWIGNGNPNISRVEECAQNRVTLIGYGSLTKNKAHLYQLPLPFDFSSHRIFRKLTVTLSYFSPIIPSIQRYRSALLWFSLENSDLFNDRENTDWTAVRRGTLQHEVFSGNQAKVWDQEDSIRVKINCAEDAGKLTEPTRYSILVSFEVAEGIDLDVYTDVVTRIREMVPVTTMVNS